MAGELEHFRMVIGGKAVDAESGATFESQNPYTGRRLAPRSRQGRVHRLDRDGPRGGPGGGRESTPSTSTWKKRRSGSSSPAEPATPSPSADPGFLGAYLGLLVRNPTTADALLPLANCGEPPIHTAT